MNELQRLDLVKAVEVPGQSMPGYVVHLPGESNDLLVCVRCGHYVWLEEAAEIRKLEERVAKKMKFGELSHELRLNGVCEPCQETSDP
jgi:Fe2+ or Zn2+ uptake regulation protein